MSIICESTLSDSYIYGMFNGDASMTKRIAEAVKNGTVLDESYIEEQILQIKRTRISPIVDDVLSAYENGTILLVYSKLIKITKAIPFVVLKMGGKNKVVVFVNCYGSIVENEHVNGGHVLNIPMKDLYVLMEGALLAYSYYQYPIKFQRSIGLMKLTNSIYTEMTMRILNKECALSIDQNLYNEIVYCVSRYYLENVWGTENPDLIFNYASQLCTGITQKSLLLTVDDDYKKAEIKTISDLIDHLRSRSPRLEKLTTRLFVEYYITMYQPPSILGMDTFPYFLFTLISSYCGSFIVKQALINDIIKNTKGANIFYNELAKLV